MRSRRFLVLVAHEWRSLAASRALWLTAALVAVLVGYGYIQAVALFAEASRTARDHAELARGMTPLDGILVPTFGAFYLAVTGRLEPFA